MIPRRFLQQRGALESCVTAAPKGFLQAAAISGAARSVSAGATTSDEPGRIRKIPRHTRFEHGDTAGGDMGQSRKAIASLRSLGVTLGSGDATRHRLHVTTRSTRVLDGLRVLPQTHGVGAGQRQAQGELCLG